MMPTDLLRSSFYLSFISSLFSTRREYLDIVFLKTLKSQNSTTIEVFHFAWVFCSQKYWCFLAESLLGNFEVFCYQTSGRKLRTKGKCKHLFIFLYDSTDVKLDPSLSQKKINLVKLMLNRETFVCSIRELIKLKAKILKNNNFQEE